jgi:hypothetical protein
LTHILHLHVDFLLEARGPAFLVVGVIAAL